MDAATKALADAADAAFNEHFDGCKKCKDAFARGPLFGGLCDQGAAMNERALEIHDGWAIEHFNEVECRKELELASSSPHPNKKIETGLRRKLLDRLGKLMCA